ncbi:MAG: HAMP domain-containing protein [Clostridia bacterium]|nr:HAMP domain-containing protein [Clostridia bacterium]
MESKRTKRKHDYRRRQRGASIYFLLWTTFSALALVIVLLFGISLRVVISQTYEKEAARELSEKGRSIEVAVVSDTPEVFGGNRSEYLRYLATSFDVRIFILDDDGEVLFPRMPETEGDASFDFSKRAQTLKDELAQSGDGFALYRENGEYVYGSKIKLYGGDSEAYLYVAKSLAFMQSALGQVGVRMTFLAVFVFVLAFALSSAVSGWLTKPISEMTKKTRRLARGDFNVDFHGADYGQEMVELADTLNFARDELSKTDRMQKELIANVSHDFKTPLTMIKGYASMILEISGDVPEKRNKHAQIIVDEADRLASLVADVLDLSKLRSGLSELKVEPVDLSAYTREILDRFAYLRETQGYVFEVEIEDGLTSQVDEIKIGQALYNLIGNAVNYTGEDKKVFVSLRRRGERSFRFAVRDTGAGIKKEELAGIWERYYRSGETHKRPVQGTGLGLSIVKATLERHGLQFGVESEPQKGSTFFVDFPLAEDFARD